MKQSETKSHRESYVNLANMCDVRGWFLELATRGKRQTLVIRNKQTKKILEIATVKDTYGEAADRIMKLVAFRGVK